MYFAFSADHRCGSRCGSPLPTGSFSSLQDVELLKQLSNLTPRTFLGLSSGTPGRKMYSTVCECDNVDKKNTAVRILNGAASQPKSSNRAESQWKLNWKPSKFVLLLTTGLCPALFHAFSRRCVEHGNLCFENEQLNHWRILVRPLTHECSISQPEDPYGQAIIHLV